MELETQLSSAKSQLRSSPSSNDNAQNNIKSSNSIQTTYDVKEVKRRLEHLNNQRSNEIDEYLNATNADDENKLSTSQNPVIQQLQIQVNQLENQVASTNVRAEDYRNQVEELESKKNTYFTGN